MIVEPDDKAKIAYMTQAVANNDAEFGDREDLDPDLEAAISWARDRTPAQIIAQREATWKAVSQFATELAYETRLWCACLLFPCRFWLDCLCMGVCRREGMADHEVARISAGVHGPLLLALAKRANYHDLSVIELFRCGAPLIGRMER